MTQLRMIAVVAFALLWVAPLAHAQEQAEQEQAQEQQQAADETFTPTSGMAGKDSVWVPTPPELVNKMLDIAGVTPKDYVIDLGSGDGRMVIAAAKRGARAHGVEYNPDMVALSQRSAKAEGVSDRATFAQGDMFEADISEATVLPLFLMPENLRRLTPTFLQLKPGTRIVVNTLGIPEWSPDRTESVEGCTSWCEAKLYIVPAQVAGTWQLPDGTLVLEQSFQHITGTLTNGRGDPIAIDEGVVNGRDVTFVAGDTRYTGRLNGRTITWTVTSGNGKQRVTARRMGD
jgi:SAM-dependent methyltransferase